MQGHSYPYGGGTKMCPGRSLLLEVKSRRALPALETCYMGTISQLRNKPALQHREYG
ncbi:hypothetical protein BKA56DRAFT_589913 [Ilyonectria sp. MPI-CAGE-AT-0026]|nr:hypothetical protein BKA56DRAFT_589913 [Ilyonectria sp. MPI-CAGE-AT-0026]